MIRATLIAGVLIAVAPLALAQEREPAESFPTPMVAPLARMVGVVALLLAVGGGLTWWSRHRRGTLPGGDNRIDVLASRGLGPRHQVVLLEVAERRLLVGVAPESVRTLADLSEVPSFASELGSAMPERDDELVHAIGRFEGLDA